MDEEEVVEAPRPASLVSRGSTFPRRRFVHPTTRYNSELYFWSVDESRSSLSHMARLNLGVPCDSWERACWRSLMCLEYSVMRLAIRNRRRLYMLMRVLVDGGGCPVEDEGVASELRHPERAARELSGDRPTQTPSLRSGSLVPPSLRSEELQPKGLPSLMSYCSDCLVPDLGLTLGQLSVFHILHARTQQPSASSLAEDGAPDPPS
jgi:hypothetical protein